PRYRMRASAAAPRGPPPPGARSGAAGPGAATVLVVGTAATAGAASATVVVVGGGGSTVRTAWGWGSLATATCVPDPAAGGAPTTARGMGRKMVIPSATALPTLVDHPMPLPPSLRADPPADPELRQMRTVGTSARPH